MAKGKITAKQQEILEYIKDCILKKGYPPAVREICEAVHLRSTSSVHAHLKPRTIEIVDDTFNLTRREIANIPMVGRVAAGEPILAEQNIVDYFPMPADMLPNVETFMLKVRGDSMINVGIYDGDNVLVARQSSVRNGEIAVCMVDDGATVKRFYKENGHYRLQPENDFMDPIITDHCEVLGKVIGLFRMM